MDKAESHLVEIVQKMAKLNPMGIAIPDIYGGGGVDIVSYAVALEEISQQCASVRMIMSANNSMVYDPTYTFGSLILTLGNVG